MSCEAEFETVDALLRSGAETVGVDAFALSLIKAERQIRRIFTHLAFQFPTFTYSDIPDLRSALSENRHVYFDGFVRGLDVLSPKCVRELVGSDYGRLRPRIEEAIEIRNKIFHGQLTGKNLSRAELLEYVNDIRGWCKALADGCHKEFGYDGFARNSFRKCQGEKLALNLRVQFTTVASYRDFIRHNMERRR